MDRQAKACVALLAGALLTWALAGVGGAQPQPAPAGDAPKAPAIAPEAMDALARMGRFLMSLKTFTVHADTSTDEVLDTGQKVQFDSQVEIHARPPGRLRADVTSARMQRQFFYDGKTLTLYAARVKYYASVAAPPTIAETVDFAREKYGLDVPLSDLFFWGGERARTADIKGAVVLGPGRIGGVECDHYAFREETVDWQVCIQKGKTPLPRKLVITTRDDDAQPQYVAVLRWDLAPKLNDKMFAFSPPAGVSRIVFREAQPAKN